MNEVQGSWDCFDKVVRARYEKNHPPKAGKYTETYYKDEDKYLKSFESYSIADIECLLDAGPCVSEFFASCGKRESRQQTFFDAIDGKYDNAKHLLQSEYNGRLNQNESDTSLLKELLDAFKDLQSFVNLLQGSGHESGRDSRFYADLENCMGVLNTVTPLYNMVRNYVTRKPYSEEKIKLNFDNSTLLNGWDVNKERDNLGVLLLKGGNYFLAIMDKKNNKVFAGNSLPSDGECYQKMYYKLLPGPNKMLPKVFFSKSRIKEFAPTQSLYENYKKGTHKKGDNFSLRDCHELIDFFKKSIMKHEDWKNFGFVFSPTESYKDISEFYKEISQQGYKLTFKDVSVSYVNQLVEEGKVYLFQLYNKDFSEFSKGVPNMHTLYWRSVFSDVNLRNVVYKLNGEAEIFFRKKSITYEKKKFEEGFHHEELKDRFCYPIIKDRRYTVDKFQFHVPITMNYLSEDSGNINESVRNFIKEGGIRHIIGIDRGERHLLYLSMIDLQGSIVKQFTLNEIINSYNGKDYVTNYHDKLDKKEGDRKEARRSWKKIESIKELKEGYLSQVIHVISKLMVEYDAIVVLEDLNFGFMRGRQKVEKQVYQKFEKMLIDKLNYLVDKQVAPCDNGGVMKAYQLTSKFESFQKLGKQTGFLFYVPAWNTSKMDPVTGFVNFINTKYESVERSKELLTKFSDIRYNSGDKYFEFEINDYASFNPKASDTRQNWTICTYGQRLNNFRNPDNNSNWETKIVDLTESFIDLFQKYDIDVQAPLKEQILSQNDKDFFVRMTKLLGLTLQMRNSRTGTEEDYLISPVKDRNGKFYDSRLGLTNLPLDADANGAYNIARKGLWAIREIEKANDVKNVNLAVSNVDWLNFVQYGLNA